MSLSVGTVSASAWESWRHLRALRHDPPGLAAVRGPRKRTFDAALEQAEQLFAAASVVGAAVRPLLLFYGLSQAGRALAAAWVSADNGQLSGHGIKSTNYRSAARVADATVECCWGLLHDDRGTLRGTEPFASDEARRPVRVATRSRELPAER